MLDAILVSLAFASAIVGAFAIVAVAIGLADRIADRLRDRG